VLKNKNIVVIGGTTGIGFSAARAFIQQGAAVVIVGRDPDSSTTAQQQLGDRCLALAADAQDPETAVQAIANCISRFGGFDGLYHVAGGSGRRFGDGPLHNMSLEGWNKTLEWNLTSLMLSNQAAVRSFLDRKQKGTILNLSSVLGYSPAAKFFPTHAYAAAKAGILGFSKAIAAAYAPQGIRVNVLAPAVVETPMAQRALTDSTIKAYLETKQPLDGGRAGKPEDLDGLAVYFMSDQSVYTTGQVIGVDGGWEISEGQFPES
jgi:NAD(P)-dependent dehydrogenase (short-subunit alcohol dehydrogenase family)